MARAATSRRSSSHRPPESAWIWLVARMQTAIRRGQQAGGDRQARALGNIVHLADDLDAVPRQRRSACASSSASGRVDPSMPGGTMPEAITAAFSSPR